MICELCNKMNKFINYIFNESVTMNQKDEVSLGYFILTLIIFVCTLLLLSWWIIPLLYLYDKCCNITFKCSNKKE